MGTDRLCSVTSHPLHLEETWAYFYFGSWCQEHCAASGERMFVFYESYDSSLDN